MKFHEKLQALRKQRGIFQEKLAELIGISRQAVAKWEAGIPCPDMDRLVALSNLLCVSIDRLAKDGEDDCVFDGTRPQLIADDEVVGFLLRAKRATYAGHGGEAPPSRTASHDLRYEEGSLQYYDTYLGGEKFAGEEALWRDGVPFWTMNYCGRILAEGFSGDFLKECLALVPPEYPYRGPLVHRNVGYTYHAVVNGEFVWFSGYEEIFLDGLKVYECVFHGGTVK